MLFTKIEGENAILLSGGVYQQVDVYERLGALYAKCGGGFVRLYSNGNTSKPTTKFETLAYSGPLFSDKLGRLMTVTGEGFKPLQIEGTEGKIVPALAHKKES